MARFAAILITAVLATGAQAADRQEIPVLQDDLHRIDPAKTLLLIKRIKTATGGGLAVS